MESPLSFNSTENFRKKLLAKNKSHKPFKHELRTDGQNTRQRSCQITRSTPKFKQKQQKGGSAKTNVK